ncbi:MAG: hypothetical protein ACYTGC_01215 [Planctomycetota bacterium]
MFRKHSTIVATGALAVVAMGLSSSLWSQTDVRERQVEKDVCRDLVTDFGVLQARVQTLDQRLYAKQSAMQSAPEEVRLAAVEAVVEELITLRGEERELLKMTHQKLMVHLMLHVTGDGYPPLAECPLMRSMTHERSYGAADFQRPGLDR